MGVVTGSFVLTCVAIVVAPGPGLAVMINQSVRSGRAAGLATVAGNTSGLVFWAFASVLGLTALVHTSELAFLVLKFTGAAYLCWLGVRALRRSRTRHGLPGPEGPEASERQPRDLLASYRAGLVTNLSNPKAAVLYLALFPQFLPTHGPVTGTVLLAAVQMAISVSWYVLVVLAIGVAQRFLSRPAVRTRLDQLTGVALVGLGIRMVVLSRTAV